MKVKELKVTEDEVEQFKRLDRGLRKKMEWIIDSKDEQ